MIKHSYSLGSGRDTWLKKNGDFVGYLPTVSTKAMRTAWLSGLLMLLLLLTGLDLQAQASTYTFANSSGTYTPITGTVWQSGATVGTDAISGQIPLGFTFRYNHKNYTSIAISNNGYIVFGPNLPAANVYVPISASSDSSTLTNKFDGTVSGFGMNLVASTGTPSIRYGTDSGDFVIQYADMARTGQTADRINFQIRLSQTTNVIRFVYGSCTATTGTGSPQIGLRGASHYDWRNLAGTTATAWTSPTSQASAGTGTSTSTLRYSNAAPIAVPVSGQTFTFTPPAGLGAPTYAALPASENFDAAPWANGVNTADLPNVNNWRTWPAYGDRSWRRQNVTAANAGWSASTSGTFTVAAPASGGVARWHTYSCTSGSTGYMDYYVNFSTPGMKQLSFSYINVNDGGADFADQLRIYISNDGGATFGSPVHTTGYSGTWANQTVLLGTSVSATTVVRFEASGNWDTTDLGLDNVAISIASAPASYCVPTIASGCTDGDVIARVTLNTLDNNSGTGCPNASGYSDYTSTPGLTTTLQAGSSYSCTVYAGQYSEAYAAWIDYNDDNFFDPITERVGFSPGLVTGSGTVGVLGSSASFPIAVACNPPIGQHRLRIRAQYDIGDAPATSGSQVLPCVNNSYGEIEDYMITISAAVACPQPSALTATNVTSTTADLSWTIGCAETAWEVAVQTAGSGTPVSGVPSASTTYHATFASGGVYEFYVRANCGGGNGDSAWSGPYIFTAPGCSTLLSPTNGQTNVPITVVAGVTQISLDWSASPGATSYEVYWGTSAGTIASLGTIGGDQVNITNVTAGTTYYWSIVPKNSLGDAVGCLSTVYSFTTAVPAGDTCAVAISLDALTSPVTGSTSGMSDNYFPSCLTSSGGPDVFYSITVPATYTFTIADTVGGYDSGRALLTGTCAALTQVACADDPDTAAVSYTNNTGSPQVVYFVQDGFSTASGSYSLSWTLTPPPIVISSFNPEAVCSYAVDGSQVVLTGSNFTNATDVQLNGASVAYTIDSDTQITVTLSASATTGTFTVYNALTSGTSGSPFAVNTPPVVEDITGPNSTCIPDEITLSNLTPTGVWSSSDMDVATISSSGVVTPVAAGTVTISYTVTDGLTGCITAETYEVTINQPVQITASTPTQTVVTGNDTSFSVTATGTGNPLLTYQWEVCTDGSGTNFVAVTDDTVYSGSNSATLMLNDVPEEFNEYFYQCTVTGICNVAISDLAVLFVGETGIDTQPSSVTVCSSGTGEASFTIVASEDVTTYQWQEDQGGDDWQDLSDGGMYDGTDSATLLLSGVTLANTGWRYRCVVTGVGTVESNPATLTVIQSVAINTDPAAQTVCYSGGLSVFSVAAAGGIASYQWQYSSNNGDNWNNVVNGTPAGASYSGATSANLNVTTTAATPAAGTHHYRAIVNSTAPCSNLPSGAAQLTINNPVINTQPAASSAFAGTSTSFTVAATTMMSIGYQWQYATAAAGPWNNVVNATPAGVTYTGINSATLNVNIAASAVSSTARYYRAVVSSGVGCSINSNAAQLSILNYCTPAMLDVDDSGDYISNFTFANINNNSGDAATDYTYYSALTANVFAGNTYNVSLTAGGTSDLYWQQFRVWIDFNHDGDFADAGESVFATSAPTYGVTPSLGTIVIPALSANVLQGVTRMRVASNYDAVVPIDSYCLGTQDYGEYEDYNINIQPIPACSGTPVAGTISSGVSNVCVSGSVVLTATGYSTNLTGITMQWHNSQGPIASANAATYTTPVLTASETYFLRVTCANGGSSADSNSVTIGVNNPQVSGTTAGERCGTGTVNLSASASSGALRWYDVASGGVPLFTGANFTTPSITGTTTYYVENSFAQSANMGTASDPAANLSAANPGFGMFFSTNLQATINSVKVYPSTAGTLIISLKDGSGTTVDSRSIAIAGGEISTTVLKTLNLGFNVPAGSTGWQLYYEGIGINRGASSYPYPVSANGFSITGNAIDGNNISPTGTRYYFYDWNVTTACNSPRLSVVATVTPPPALTLSGSAATLCPGESENVTITSNVADFNDYQWSPSNGVSGDANSGYVFNPSASTNYTLTATNVAGCVNTATFNVTVNAQPSTLSIVPGNSSVCSTDAAQLLTSSGGTSAASITSGSGTGTTLPGTTASTLGPNPFQDFYGGTKQQWIYRASELTALGFTPGTIINSIKLNMAAVDATVLSNMVVKMKNSAKTEFTSTTNWDTSMVTVRPAASYATSVGLNTIALTTPFTWDGTSSLVIEVNYSNNNGGAATSLNTAMYSATSFVSTIFYRVDNATAATVNNFTGTASFTYSQRNDVVFDVSVPSSVVWSSSVANSLFTDAAATLAYTGSPSASVYAKPASAATITATGTNAGGCEVSAQATISVNTATVWYVDADGDGYGNSALPTVLACSQQPNTAVQGGDCNDAVASIHPNAVEVPYNGVDDDCDGTIDETGTVTTTLLASSCGVTLTSIGSLVGIQTVGGHPITGYRIRITNGSEVQMIEKTVPHFTIPQFPSYAYATTYTVDIQLQRAGIWQASWGATCLVSTPAILEEGGAAAVSPSQCGITLPKINTLIATTSLAGVTGYRFRVTNLTDPLGPNAVQTIDRTQNWFSLPMLTRYNFGTTYRIEVAVKTTGAFGGFGSPCEVSSPAVPTLINCGGTVASGTATISATSVEGATQYRFQIVRQSDNASTTIDRSNNWFIFNSVPASAFTAGALYGVRVAVMTKGTWSPFGDVCEITAPGAVARPGVSAETEASAGDVFKATAYPNPYTADFSLNVISSSKENVQLQVYDMLGKLIETREVKFSELDLTKVGAQYPSGVYNVIVSQEGVVKTLRVIKR